MRRRAPYPVDDTRVVMLTGVKKVEGDVGAPAGGPGFATGLRDGIPIALGYFTVSIAFGLAAAAVGFPTVGLALMSATNLSSSGQFAGVAVVAGGTVIELALTTVLVNLRYVLMSMSLSQRLEPGTSTVGRLVVAYGVTDEIFAVELGHRVVRARYAAGLMALPILGWTSGTVVGALAGEVLPESLAGARSAGNTVRTRAC